MAGRNTINNDKVTLKEILEKYGLKRAFIFFVLGLFFASLIIAYNIILGSYIRENIRTKSELNAHESAKDVEIYLSTGTDIIGVTEHKVVDLLKADATNEEILDFLTEETHAIQYSILPATTGLYGCIRGEYFDGSGWVPDPDYVAQERPWYTEAVVDPGETVLINPYFDLYSSEVVMTIARALPDGENVVAIDITLGRIQEITEERLGTGSDTIRMVISTNGFVVANSDATERGRNYLEEKDSFGGKVLAKAIESTGDYSELKYLGHNYIVYSIPIGNGWRSISVVDSRNEYKPLIILLTVSTLLIIATFVIFAVIMLRTGRRTIINDKLKSILSSSADIYMSLCDLDVINNTVTGIKNVNPAIAKAVESCDGNMKELFLGIMKNLPDSPTKQAAMDFTDLSDIDERMKDTDSAMVEYISYGNIWVRARFVVSERTSDGRVSHVLWMLENVDAERKERERLINASERAIAASEAKSAFLSNMSHEIRTPINAILGMNEVILRECKDENILGYSRNILSSGHTLLELVNDILDVSKIESGKMEIIPVDYSVASMLNDLINIIKVRIDTKELELKLDIDRNIPAILHGDDVRLRQVITNILTNAVKYTEKGSITFSVSAEETEYDPTSISLHVSVKDTGIGIKKEDMTKLFSEFERIEEKRNRNIEGTGLGMAITQSLLSLMHSSLKVESVYGEGSKFSFDIVQGVVDRTPIGDFESEYRRVSEESDVYRGSFTAPDAHLLVVDDTPMNILVFTSLLEPTKIQIDTAGSGDEGILYALNNKYDIIFLDHMMPGKDGIATLHELKAHSQNANKDTPVICLTANAISGAREQYIEAGFDDYLTKPINSKSLEEMIAKYLPEDKLIKEDEDKEGKSVTVSGATGETVMLPDFVFTIRDLDPMEGIRKCGSEKIYLNALAAFGRYIEPIINATHAYVKNNDMRDVLINVHSLNTAAKTVGAKRISRMAHEMEEAGMEGFSEEKLEELFDKCIEMRNCLLPLLNK